jgi:multidrug efflux pump subunit AcrB
MPDAPADHPINPASAGIGALLMLQGFGFGPDVIEIDIFLPIGIVKKNGIMLIDFAVHAERERGLIHEQSIHEACLLRFRPILMTTLGALLCTLPLMSDSGTRSELRKPLCYTIAGGLIFFQALTLFTTPAVYLYMEKLVGWRARRGVSLATIPGEQALIELAGMACRPA